LAGAALLKVLCGGLLLNLLGGGGVLLNLLGGGVLLKLLWGSDWPPGGTLLKGLPGGRDDLLAPSTPGAAPAAGRSVNRSRNSACVKSGSKGPALPRLTKIFSALPRSPSLRQRRMAFRLPLTVCVAPISSL